MSDAPMKRTRKPAPTAPKLYEKNGVLVGHAGKPITMAEVNAARDGDPPAPPPEPGMRWQQEFEGGWVVRARLHAPGWFTSPDRSRGRGVIIEASPDLQRAHWFKASERDQAEQTAAWQMGFVKMARRNKATGVIEEVAP